VNVPGIALSAKAQELLDTFVHQPSQSVLLTGPLGTGKTQVAQSVAAALLRTTTALDHHAYYRVVRPDKGSVSIEQVRELTNFFRLKVPGPEAIKRVAVLEDADTMGHEAQNALLKLLEEPPHDSVLVLTSSRPEHLLATIRSRVQTLQLGSPSSSELTEYFRTEGYDEPTVAAAILRSGSNVAAAHRILTGEDPADEVVGLVKQALSGSSYERLLLVDGLAKQKDLAITFVDTLATVAMASLQSAAQKGAASLKRWQQVLEAANTAQEALEQKGNAKLVLSELMLSL
jgi:DNA polymerase III delta prime subunit